MSKQIPRCKDCGKDHWNMQPCPQPGSGLYGWGTMKWQEQEGMHEWGDRVAVDRDGGWGCKTVLPKES